MRYSVFRARENWASNAELRDSTRGASISISISGGLLQCPGIQKHIGEGRRRLLEQSSSPCALRTSSADENIRA